MAHPGWPRADCTCSNRRVVWRVAVAVATPVLASAGCGPLVRHPPYVPQPTSALVRVTAAPPPARVEILPPAPSGDAVYVDGEWTWRRGRWSWMAGRWVVPPAGESFSPWVFVRDPDGHYWYAPGVWRDASGDVVAGPNPIAVASVETGAIVSPNGEPTVTGPTLRRHAGPVSAPTSGPAPAPSSEPAPVPSSPAPAPSSEPAPAPSSVPATAPSR